MMNYINVKHLTDINACEEQVNLFKKLFGDKVEFSSKEEAEALAIKVAQKFDFSYIGAEYFKLPYREAVAPLSKTYEETRAHLWKAYKEAKAPLSKTYEETRARLWKAYKEAKAPLWKAYEEAEARLWKAYKEAKARLWKAYKEAKAPLSKTYEEAEAKVFAEMWWDK